MATGTILEYDLLVWLQGTLVQWPPSGPQVLGEIEKPAVPKMGRRMPTCSKHEG